MHVERTNDAYCENPYIAKVYLSLKSSFLVWHTHSYGYSRNHKGSFWRPSFLPPRTYMPRRIPLWKIMHLCGFGQPVYADDGIDSGVAGTSVNFHVI